VLSEVAIGSTLMTVIGAYRRLSLYEVAPALVGIWSKRRWFVGATASSAVILMLSLNFLNRAVQLEAQSTMTSRWSWFAMSARASDDRRGRGGWSADVPDFTTFHPLNPPIGIAHLSIGGVGIDRGA
jgi:hypothetical protein